MPYFFLFIISLLNLATAKVLYITPSTSDLCTTQCLTISELAANTSNYISSNTTLVFTAGTHHLTANLTVSDVNNVSITSNGSLSAIVCMNHSYINLIHSQSIHISNMNFLGYGGINVSNVEEFVLQNAVFDGQDKTELSLTLIYSTANVTNCSYISNIIEPMSYVADGEWIRRNGLVVVIDSNYISFSQCKFDNNEVLHSADTSVMSVINSWVAIDSSTFVNNTAASLSHWDDMNVIYQERGHVDISNSYFYGNSANSVFKSTSSGSLNVTNSSFSGNTGTYPSGQDKSFGGVFTLFYSNVFARNNSFDNNNADAGGVLYSEESSVMFETCSFDYNYANSGGGVLFAHNSSITVKECNITCNTAWWGAVIEVEDSFVVFETSLFDSNHADLGGVLRSDRSHITVKDCNFAHNTAAKGAVIHSEKTLLTMKSSVVIANNVATKYATVYLDECKVNIWDDHVIFSNNTGSFVAYNAYVSFMGYTNFLNNQINAQDDNILEGGAITLFLSVIHFDGSCNVSYNHAENGGAIRSSESKVYVNGNLTVTHNSANESGGGIYLYNSEMNCSDCSLQLSHNTAKSRGGGIHAIASTIKLRSVYYSIVKLKVVFINNTAEKGGGLSMESNSKLYLLSPVRVYYVGNSAVYGAAMFVDDDTYTSTCSRKLKGECFFQLLGEVDERFLRNYLQFSQNTARYSGSILYGGLLDRCAVSPFVELSRYSRLDPKFKTNGLIHFKLATDSTNLSISSDPIKVCHCDNKEYDCELNYTLSKAVRKGEVFTVSVVAVDQLSRPVNATIQSSLTHSESGLAEGQLSREIKHRVQNPRRVTKPEPIASTHAQKGPRIAHS